MDEYGELELVNDKRIGKRALYTCDRAINMNCFGTIERIVLYDTGIEYLTVLLDVGMRVDGTSDSFLLHEGKEFVGGDKVRYSLKEGGFWEAIIVLPYLDEDMLRYLSLVVSSEKSARPVNYGFVFLAEPDKLTKLK